MTQEFSQPEHTQEEQDVKVNPNLSSPKILFTRATDASLSSHLQEPPPADRSDEADEADEETPLLSVNAIPVPSSETNPIIMIVLVSFLILTTIIYVIIRDIDGSASQAVNIQLDAVAISSITPFGLDAHIQGKVDVDYNTVSKFFHRNILKLGALILGNLTISHVLPVEIFTKVVDVNSPFVHMVDTLPPIMNIDIHPSNTTNKFDFITPCNFTNSNFWEFLKYFNQVNSNIVNLEIKGIANANVKARFLSVNVPNVEFREFIQISKQDLVPEIGLDGLEVTSSDKGLSLEASINIENDYSISLFLNSINWKVMLPDCDSNLIDIGNWKSSPILISPKIPISVSVLGEVASVPSKLTHDCPSDKTSPVFRLIHRYLQNEPLYIYLSACEEQDDADLPDWIISMLSSMNQRIEIKLPRPDWEPVNLIEFINNSTEVLVNPTKDDNSFSTHLLSNFTLDVQNIVPIPFNVPRFRSEFTIYQNKSTLLRGTSNSHNQISLSEDCCHISTNTDSELTIIDSVSLGKLVRDVISSIEYDPVLLDVNLYDLVIETPILNMTVTNFTLASIPLFPGPNNLFLLTENQDSDFLNQLNATVHSVLYVGSSPTSLELLVDISIFNPTNITFDLPNEVLELGVIYNNTNLAYGTIKDVFIPQNEQVNMSVGCTIKSETNEYKAVLEYFLSEFVSGGYEDSSIKINIGNNHVYNNPGLNKLVEQINITNLTIPNISLPLPEKSEQVAVKSCPFIVQATIHIFSSEVELTVLNPIVNHELIVEVFQAEAKYKDIVLGYLQQRERLIVPPGIYKTPKLPIKINSIGMDVLKKAMNGELDVEVLAILNVQLDEFDVHLFYKGNGLKSKIGF